MKKLKLFDNSIIEADLGWDFINGWQIPPNVLEVEFEDGTILENPNYVAQE